MPKKLTKEQKDQIIELWRRDYKLKAIHNETGYAAETIKNVLKERCNDSPAKRNERKRNEMCEIFKNEYLNGMSAIAIAEKYGCDYDVVRIYLKKNLPEYKSIVTYKDRFTDEEIRMIVDEYRIHELSNAQICEKWNISDQTLKRLVIHINNLKER